MLPRCRFAVVVLVAVLCGSSLLVGAVDGGHTSIGVGDLRTWLTYIASDDLEGRATYSRGLTRAADYIQRHLAEWGVEPAGGDGTYLQTVRVHRVKATSRSHIVVRVGGRTQTFADGDGVTFPLNAGGNQDVTFSRVEFVGYGLDLPSVGQEDLSDVDVAGAVLVWLGPSGPSSLDGDALRRVLSARSRHAVDELGAGATIGPAGRADADRGRTFTTSQALDRPRTPIVTADDDLFRFLLSKAPISYDELKRRADAREVLPTFHLDDVAVAFHVDHDYDIEEMAVTENIVALVPGRDAALRHTHVAYGAHYDHVGRAEAARQDGGGSSTAPGRVMDGAEADRIWNGADDDGSGTVALMMLARAFARGPRPRRSVLFVWHSGEERGLWGSRYFVDFPTVPLVDIVAQLNVDMVGRNRDDQPSESNTVYLVGSDRISSELHAISQEANAALASPLTLDYQMNDPSDPEQLYSRSDHYSYASRGIPVIFFTTGLHPDYHANTDDVSKIDFDKLARVTHLLYETGSRLGDLDHAPLRDHRGPRAGKEPR